MTIEKLKQENGHFEYRGETYVLIRQAYIDGPEDAPYFVGKAIIPADGADEDGLYDVYDVVWYCTDEWLAGDMGDEGDACDWDCPDEVAKSTSGYNLEQDRII